jgi:hypothetical protein
LKNQFSSVATFYYNERSYEQKFESFSILAVHYQDKKESNTNDNLND